MFRTGEWDEMPLVQFACDDTDIRCGPFGTQLQQHQFQHEGVPLWGIRQVNHAFRIQTNEFVSLEKFEALRQYSLEPGDIVKGTIGNCAVYPEGFGPGVMHSDLLRIRVDRSRHHPRFVADQLRFRREFTERLALMSGGAIMPGINVTRLKRLTAFAPSKGVQDRYAKLAEGADSNATTQGRHLAALNSLFASLQHRAFNGELAAPLNISA